jgi:hypothetical protein
MSILAKRQGSLHPRNVFREEPRAARLSLDKLIGLNRSLHLDIQYPTATAFLENDETC